MQTQPHQSNPRSEPDIVDVIFRLRWVPIALMGVVSLGPFFGWS